MLRNRVTRLRARSITRSPSNPRRVGAVGAGCLICLALGMLTPSPAGAFGNNAQGHLGITQGALNSISRQVEGEDLRFTPRAIMQVKDANQAVDLNQLAAYLHFDDEAFQGGTTRLVVLKQAIIAEITAAEADGEAAREYLGQALHTLQDFYAHTNWIELHGRTTDGRLGNEIYAGPGLGTHTSPLFDPGTLLPGLRVLTSGYFRILAEPFATIPYPCFAPLYKTRHGYALCSDGLNKDHPDRPGWADAWLAADQASEDYVNAILDTDGVRGNAKAIKALMGIHGTLAFAIDTTGSMDDEIGDVKDQTRGLVTDLRGTDKEPDEYVLTTFKDSASTDVKTTDADTFLAAIDHLEADGGDDCPEASQSGLLEAVRAAKRDSKAYLFTDASSGDADLAGRVTAEAHEKRIEISAFATGSCSPLDPVYLDETERTGGQTLSLDPTELPQAFALIRTGIAPNAVSIFAASDDDDEPRDFSVPIDSSVSRVTFSVSDPDGGRTVSLTDPTGNVVPATAPASNAFVAVVENPSPGAWSMHVAGGGPFTVDVNGESPLAFASFDFVERQGRPEHESYYPVSQALGGGDQRAAAHLLGPYDTATFELVSPSGASIAPISLTKGDPLAADADDFTGVFTPPQGLFKVAATGRDSAGFPYRRAFPAAFRTQTIDVSLHGAAPLEGSGCCVDVPFTVRNSGPPGTFDIEAMVGDDPDAASVSRQSVDLSSGASAEVVVTANLSGKHADEKTVTALATSEDDPFATSRASVAILAESKFVSRISTPTVPQPSCPLKGRVLVSSNSPAVLKGGAGTDIIVGTGGADTLSGRAGKDCLYGYGGKDRLFGGKGADRLFGGTGRDLLTGGQGTDRLIDDSGRDRFSGGPGDDRISSRDLLPADRRRPDQVACGRGRHDVATVDRRDRVRRDCERVRRPRSKRR